jgi:hypothetical protein
MTVKIKGEFKVYKLPPETVFLYEKTLDHSSVNQLCFDVANVTEYDKFDEFSVTLELDNFVRNVREDKNTKYWNDKQPFAENSGYDKLKLVVCYGRPDWFGRSNEKKSITFNPKDKSVFLCWIVDDVAVIDSIKSNTYTNKKIILHIVLNEEDVFFKENEDDYLKNPKLRSFSLMFE